jgi:hypothetical protein
MAIPLTALTVSTITHLVCIVSQVHGLAAGPHDHVFLAPTYPLLSGGAGPVPGTLFPHHQLPLTPFVRMARVEVPVGWEAVMGSRLAKTPPTGTTGKPELTRCDFTMDPTAARAHAPIPSGQEAVDALENALDKLHEEQV